MSSSNSMPRGAVRSAAGKSDFTSFNAVTAVNCEAVKLMFSSCQAHLGQASRASCHILSSCASCASGASCLA